MDNQWVNIAPLKLKPEEGELVQSTLTGEMYIYKDREFKLVEDYHEEYTPYIPKWLKEDVKNLALEEVRLSCAVHDLYKHYADTPTSHMEVDERSEFLMLVNDRLDWIDSNIDIVEYTINNYCK